MSEITETIEFDPSAAYAAAHEKALNTEEQARLLLWDRVSDKANEDVQFRRLLAENPQQAIEQEAKALNVTDEEVVKGVAEKVATLSRFVPGVDSQKVEDLIFGTIEDIRRSFKITTLLSQILFYTGLAMMVVAFIAALWDGENQIVSLVFGAGGAGSVLISSLVLGPIDRVQNAAGNLVQLQMAYLAYYKQLYLLGGNSESLSTKDTISYTKEIDRAATSLMSAIQTHVEVSTAAKTETEKPEDKQPQIKKPAPQIKKPEAEQPEAETPGDTE